MESGENQIVLYSAGLNLYSSNMDSIKNLLIQKDLDEPTEVTALKNYCQQQFHFTAKISLSQDVLWLTVPNGILATELRMRQTDIIARCGITKKLRIKIG